MSELAYYFDRIADEFNGYYTGRRPTLIQEAGYRLFRGPGLKKRFLHTTKIVGECKDAKILDVGCGPGIYAQYFAQKKARVTAIDMSQNMIELARRNLSKTGVRDVKLIRGDFLQYDFADTFDYSLAVGLFDYVGAFKRDAYFDKLKRITIKKVIATFPRMFVFQAPIRWILFFMKGQPVFFYTKRIIIDIAKRHNLKTNFYNSGPIWTVEFTNA
jgi:ubiquinone/menaquinone biosynthesis C-methylase UbiE